MCVPFTCMCLAFPRLVQSAINLSTHRWTLCSSSFFCMQFVLRASTLISQLTTSAHLRTCHLLVFCLFVRRHTNVNWISKGNNVRCASTRLCICTCTRITCDCVGVLSSLLYHKRPFTHWVIEGLDELLVHTVLLFSVLWLIQGHAAWLLWHKIYPRFSFSFFFNCHS